MSHDQDIIKYKFTWHSQTSKVIDNAVYSNRIKSQLQYFWGNVVFLGKSTEPVVIAEVT